MSKALVRGEERLVFSKMISDCITGDRQGLITNNSVSLISLRSSQLLIAWIRDLFLMNSSN